MLHRFLLLFSFVLATPAFSVGSCPGIVPGDNPIFFPDGGCDTLRQLVVSTSTDFQDATRKLLNVVRNNNYFRGQEVSVLGLNHEAAALRFTVSQRTVSKQTLTTAWDRLQDQFERTLYMLTERNMGLHNPDVTLHTRNVAVAFTKLRERVKSILTLE